jgi:Na+-driven multidrug efflux pump
VKSTAPQLLSAPIVPTLARLSAPGILLVAFQSMVSVGDTYFVGRLGTAPLAGLALVFPLVMLLQMTSAGAMGGGVSSAIARALGAGDAARAAPGGACAGDRRGYGCRFYASDSFFWQTFVSLARWRRRNP